MYTPPVYFVVGLSDIGLFDLSVELSDLFVLSDYFVESSMQRFGQNNPISTVHSFLCCELSSYLVGSRVAGLLNIGNSQNTVSSSTLGTWIFRDDSVPSRKLGKPRQGGLRLT